MKLSRRKVLVGAASVVGVATVGISALPQIPQRFEWRGIWKIRDMRWRATCATADRPWSLVHEVALENTCRIIEWIRVDPALDFKIGDMVELT
jgi:hypothetical protein